MWLYWRKHISVSFLSGDLLGTFDVEIRAKIPFIDRFQDFDFWAIYEFFKYILLKF